MATWDFISKRRRIRLAKFVEGATTLEEALDIFRRKGVTPPDDGTLEKLFVSEPEPPGDAAKVEVEVLERDSETLTADSKEFFTAKPQKQTASSKKSGSKKKKQTLQKETATDDELGSDDDL
jgi:hypothetical protein